MFLAVDRLVVEHARSREKILNQVSFQIDPGEIVALLGESGSGKTTLARAIVDLLPPTLIRSAGRIRIGAGARTKDQSTRLHREWIHYLPQNGQAALNPRWTIGRHLSQVTSRRRDRIISLLHALGIPDPGHLLDCYPLEISGGEARMASLLLAEAGSPRMLILDEPFRALGNQQRDQLKKHLRHLNQATATTILVIGHQTRYLVEMSSRVLVLKDGTVIDDFSTDAIDSATLHPYSADLLEKFRYTSENH